MKILIVGSNKVWALENIYAKELVNNSSVEIFNAHGLFLDYYHKRNLNKLVYRLGLSSILKRINQVLLQHIGKFKPDVVWVFKGMEVFPRTLTEIKKKNIVLVNYNGDNPFDFTFRGSGNENVSKSLNLYDHHFSYNQSFVQKFKNEFNLSASWLPFGYDLRKEPPKDRNSIKNKVCFVGNPDKVRARIINTLIQNNISVDVYGSNWDQFINKSDLVNTFPHILGVDFIEKVQEYRLQLNIFRPQNKDSHNMRTFEMPALGVIMLAPFSAEHSQLFEEGKEVYYFNDDEELVAKTKLILSLSSEEAHQISINAYQKSVLNKCSYNERAKEVLTIFENLFNREKD